MGLVTRRTELSIVSLTIERPEALNALNYQLLHELKSELDEIAKISCTAFNTGQISEQTPRVLLIKGGGNRAFVAGADIVELRDSLHSNSEFLSAGISLMKSLENLDIPTLACVSGFCLGGGFELTLSCDLILAKEGSKFALPEISLGLIPGFGGTQRLAYRTGVGFARRIIFTGEMIDAKHALSVGAIDWVSSAEEYENEIERIAKQLSQRSPLALRAAKRAVQQVEIQFKNKGLKQEEQLFRAQLSTRDGYEGLTAFIEKRSPKFEGR